MSTLKRYNGTSWETIGGNITGDTLPIGSEIDYTGSSVPAGWEEVADYSTNEIDTGMKWIDGRHIYRKVLEYSKSANESHSNILHGISNIDWLIRVEAMSKFDNQFRPLPTFYSSDVSTYNQSIYYIDSTIVGIYYSSWYAARASKIYVVMEYTKTTD